MAPKSKKTGEVAKEAVVEPEAKKAKVDEPKAEEPKTETPEEKPAPKVFVLEEKEVDDKADKKPKFGETIGFDTPSTTLNVLPTMGGKVLTALQEGGFQYLLAGARANTAMKSGRYLFEARIVEALNPSEGGQSQWRGGKTPMPRQLLRIGFSTEGSALVLGAELEHAVYFDSDGGYCSLSGRKRGQRFAKGQVVGVILNLDAKSPNANTVSLFVNGKRASEPQPLPEELKGKPLFPHIAYRNVTVHVNFGPEPLTALPFKCTSLQAAAASDVAFTKVQAPKDGKYEVVYPVGFPDEGTFEWLDAFLGQNKTHVELSGRKLAQWAAQSGFFGGRFKSNDWPEVQYGVPGMDDQSVRKLANAMATVVPRNYVVMEVKENLVAADREKNLKRFPKSLYKKVAYVAMGEPNAAFKKIVKDKLIKTKQVRVDAEYKARQMDKERKKAAAKRQKELAEQKAKRIEEAKKKNEEAKKKAEEAKKAKEGEKKDGEEEKKEEPKAEEKAAEPEKKEDEAAKVEEAVEEPEEAPPGPVTLTEEEEKQWFLKSPIPDLALQYLEKNFGQFTIPQKSEGFDDIRFDWQNEKKSQTYLQTWVLEKKKTTKVDNLVIGEWFRTQQAEWVKTLGEWKAKQTAAKAAPKKDDEEKAKVDDIFDIEDVCDVGNGEPLFMSFDADDWALVNLRWEFYTFLTAFKKDVDDADREKVPEAHVGFYFQKYFKKNILPKQFGKESLGDLTALVKDTVSLSDGVLTTPLSEANLGLFVKHTEENRRERQRRLDAGDEGARLFIQHLKGHQPAPKAEAGGKAAGKGQKKK